MAETANIAKIAEKLSKELFAEFLWTQVGPMNHNWACEESDVHKVKTHPSDVVFYYDEPYSRTRTYVNCDLKSYAKNTIKAQTIQGAIENLARAVACAEKSDEWRQQYVHDHVAAEVCGLLFVYNHDGEYDKDFASHIRATKLEKLLLPKGSKLVVLGPEDIQWLDNVRLDIAIMRGQGKLPPRDACKFYYPHLVRRPNVQLETARAATLEMLTAPWILLEYRLPNQPTKRGFVVFYRRLGDESAEFLYLIDYLKHYQVLQLDTAVQLRTFDTAPTAHANFQKAVQQYIDECGPETSIANLLKSISYEKITQVASTFSDIELGMDYG